MGRSSSDVIQARNDTVTSKVSQMQGIGEGLQPCSQNEQAESLSQRGRFGGEVEAAGVRWQ